MKNKELRFFEALIDVFFNSIDRKNYKLLKTLSRFFYDAFRKERDNSLKEPVIYPELYYELIYKSIEKLANIKDIKLKYLQKRTVGSLWLLGELQDSKISENTYSWIWRNLLLAIQYNKDEMILDHWETADQYKSYYLRPIYPEYNYTNHREQPKITNQEMVNKRDKDRKRFVEFHYALGGLLVYKKLYNCIKNIFEYTASIPPKFELLPESMDEIFQYFNKIRDPYEVNYTWISSRYPFPNLRGLNSDYEIKKWISSYIALLFLRQYTIIPHLITMKPLDYPRIPELQSEIKQWIDGLDFFKTLVSQHLINKDLLLITNLDFITHEWCKINKKIHPMDFIDKLKELLITAYQQNAIKLPIDENRVRMFENATKKIIESKLLEFNKIYNNEIIEGHSDRWYVKGQRMLQSKDAFSKNPEVDYGNFDSILASALSDNINSGISSTFLFKKSKSFVLEPEHIFKGIDKLEINNKDFVIIGFGFNFDYYLNQIKVPLLIENKYKNIEIYSFSNSRVVDSSLFILKKSDLPNISTVAIDPSVIEKYSLKKVSDSHNLYASVIDLNKTTEDIFNENKENKEDDDLKKSVLMNIIISIEIKWKKDVNMIQFIEYSKYRQKGFPNSIKDIKSFK